MSCGADLIKQAREEYYRLEDLKEQGYTEDLDNMIGNIDEAMEVMKAIVDKEPDLVREISTKVSEDAINTLNSNRPRVKNAPVTVVSGEVSSGRVLYKIRYPNGKKDYTVNALEITADQVDAKELGKQRCAR